jgi:hypothetical protein
VHPCRIVTLAGIAVAGIALFLPQAHFPLVGPVDGFAGDAWPVMLLLTPLALPALLGDRDAGYRPAAAVLAVLLSCGALVFAVAKVVDAAAAVGPLEGARMGAGVWVVAAGAAVVVAGSLLSFSRRLG